MSQTWQICLAIFVLKCLSFCGWMKETIGPKLTDHQVYLALLCIHMRGVTTYNTHQVGERNPQSLSLLQTQEVGLGVRPTVALLNHSCWPNTVRCSAGRHVVIMASATIHPGTEVSDIYTQCYYDQDQVTRNTKCQEYRFTCQCQACCQHWPMLDCLHGSLQDTPPSGLQDNIPR